MKKHLKKFTLYHLPLIIWMGVIFWASSMTGNGGGGNLPLGQLLLRKGAHVGEFFLLTILMYRVVALHISRVGESILLTGFFALVYSLSDEFHQLFVFGREGKLPDVGIDLLGILFALIGIYVWMKCIKHAKFSDKKKK